MPGGRVKSQVARATKKLTRPLKEHSLRKAAKRSGSKSASAQPAPASTATNSGGASAKSTARPRRLVDGEKVQIHARRHGAASPAAKKARQSHPALAGAITGAGVKKPKKSLRPKKLLQSRKSSTTKVVAAKAVKTSRPKKSSRSSSNAMSKSAPRAQRRRRQQLTRGDLINAESRLGSKIFGPIPAGHRREFFHDQQNIWIWHEAWTDDEGHDRQMTVRYEVRPSGVYKKLSAGKYVKLEKSELENFRRATHAYLETIKRDLYHRV